MFEKMVSELKYVLFWMVCSFCLLLHLVRTCEDSAHSVPVGGLQPWKGKKTQALVLTNQVYSQLASRARFYTNSLWFCASA